VIITGLPGKKEGISVAFFNFIGYNYVTGKNDFPGMPDIMIKMSHIYRLERKSPNINEIAFPICFYQNAFSITPEFVTDSQDCSSYIRERGEWII
jgi:hypothetical protein